MSPRVKLAFTVAGILVLATWSARSARAAEVFGTFDGTIYLSSGVYGDMPITGSFEYDTASFVNICTDGCANSGIFASTSPTSLSITEHSALGDYVFSYAGDYGFSVQSDQLNFGAHQNMSSPNYSILDVILQTNEFSPNALPTDFSANLVPFQGSSETYLNGTNYDFYISQISASEVSQLPIPGAVTLFASAIVGMIGFSFLAGRRARHL